MPSLCPISLYQRGKNSQAMRLMDERHQGWHKMMMAWGCWTMEMVTTCLLQTLHVSSEVCRGDPVALRCANLSKKKKDMSGSSL